MRKNSFSFPQRDFHSCSNYFLFLHGWYYYFIFNSHKKAEKKITQKSAFNLIQDEQNDLLAFFLFFCCVYNLDTQNPFFNEQKNKYNITEI